MGRVTYKTLVEHLAHVAEYIGLSAPSKPTGFDIRDRAPYYDLTQQDHRTTGINVRKDGLTAKEMNAFLDGMSFGAKLAKLIDNPPSRHDMTEGPQAYRYEQIDTDPALGVERFLARYEQLIFEVAPMDTWEEEYWQVSSIYRFRTKIVRF